MILSLRENQNLVFHRLIIVTHQWALWSFVIIFLEVFMQPIHRISIATGSECGTLFTNATQVGDFRQLNDCDVEEPGYNFASCNNEIQRFDNQSFTTNLANGDGKFNLSNIALSKQIVNQQNDCDATENGDNTVACRNDALTMIDSISLINDAKGGGAFNQANQATLGQTVNQQNDCDESGNGNNTAICGGAAGTLHLWCPPILNTASNSSTADQTNEALFSQTVNQHNDCDESGDGNNPVFCRDAAGLLIPGVSQSNTASNSSTADQTNEHCSHNSKSTKRSR